MEVRAVQVGQRIRQLRGEMKQSVLATAAGLDQSALSRIESGERPVQLDELVALAVELGVEPGALLKADEPLFAFRASDGSEVAEALQACSKIIDDYLALDALVGGS